MNPALILAAADKLPAILGFIAECYRQGRPVLEAAVELAKASDEPQAKALLAQLRAAYEASGAAADTNLEKLLASSA